MTDRELIEKYSAWIYKLAYKYASNRNHYLESEDLISIGQVAIFEAIKNYNPDNKPGAKLDTYVLNHIRHRMQSAMRDCGDYNSSQQNAMVIMRSILNKIGEDATPYQISEFCKDYYKDTSTYSWSLEQAENYLNLYKTKTYSLNMFDKDGSDDRWKTNKFELVSDENIEDIMSDFQEKEILYNEINKLKPQYKQVMVGRIIHEKTLLELGHEMGLSRERIRQIENSATKIIIRNIKKLKGRDSLNGIKSKPLKSQQPVKIKKPNKPTPKFSKPSKTIPIYVKDYNNNVYYVVTDLLYGYQVECLSTGKHTTLKYSECREYSYSR